MPFSNVFKIKNRCKNKNVKNKKHAVNINVKKLLHQCYVGPASDAKLRAMLWRVYLNSSVLLYYEHIMHKNYQ